MVKATGSSSNEEGAYALSAHVPTAAQAPPQHSWGQAGASILTTQKTPAELSLSLFFWGGVSV